MSYLRIFPSKTFILGEYAVLNQMPAILLCTAPQFLFQINARDPAIPPNFHPNSPAGKLYRRYDKHFAIQQIKFYDPHHGKGGFGASTAQYAGLYQYCVEEKIIPKFTQSECIAHYQSLASRTHHLPPSGADLAAQLALQSESNWFEPQLCIYHPDTQQLQHGAWPFKDLTYLVLATQHNLPTHEHLNQLQLPNTDPLVDPLEQGLASIASGNSEQFCQAVIDYRHQLTRMGFETGNTQKLCKQLGKHKNILAAKGCGAMGADVITVFFKPENKPAVLRTLQTMPVQIIGVDHYAKLSAVH